MLSKLRSRLTFANVVALLALVVALGGSSYAAVQVTGKDVRNSSLTGKDIKDSSLKTADVRNGSLLAGDFKPGQLPAGPQGVPGPPGQTGAKGEPGVDGTDATVDGVPAGGGLSGTYPNPSIAAGAITPEAFAGVAFPTARARATVNQVIGDFATDLVHLQTNVHRREVDHNTGTTDSQTCGASDPTPGDCFLTVTLPGTYLITGAVTFAFSSVGFRQLLLTGWNTDVTDPFPLGSDMRSAVQASTGQTSPPTTLSVSTVYQLTAGQSVSLIASQNSGAGLGVFGGNNSQTSTLTLTWIAPF